jgi:hypothetical protein
MCWRRRCTRVGPGSRSCGRCCSRSRATEDVGRKLAAFDALGVLASRVVGKAMVPLSVAAHGTASLARGHGLPYFIGPGGSSPLGTLGYAAAALELAEQVHAGVLPEPAAIYVPLGSGGTAAGLLLGARLGGLASRVCAVRVRPCWPTPRLGGGVVDQCCSGTRTASTVEAMPSERRRLAGDPRARRSRASWSPAAGASEAFR